MYLKTSQDLAKVLENAPSSAVILNSPRQDEDDEALPMSRVLHGLLRGYTRSFTALVGFFGHRVNQEVINRYESVNQSTELGEFSGESPAGLIVREAIEENVHAGDDFDHTSFRLLAGAMSSKAARDAARAWYWLCRFRHEAENGIETTDDLRSSFLSRVEGPEESFVGAATALLEPEEYTDSPFGLAPVDFVSHLDPSETPGDQVEKILRETLFDEVIQGSLKNRGAAILLGFFLQRRADFRLNPQSEGSGTFHPKIYVVERGNGTDSKQTGTIVGSHNWTVPGLGLSEDEGLKEANVEVATVHVNGGHHWGEDGEPDYTLSSPLGSRVCATARHLFENAKYSLGSWGYRAENVLPAPRLKEATRSRAGELQFRQETESRETFRSLLVYLRRLVADLSHLNLEDQHDEFFDRFRLTGQFEASPNGGAEDKAEVEEKEVLFGGKIPASYQVDGAVRLLSILEETGGGGGSRGAFLTDEAGLGKTLSAKMSLAILAATRIAERKAEGTPLKMSLVVPAALTGSPSKDGQAPSGWHLHAREVRRATRALLKDVKDVEPDEANTLTSEGHLQIRVFSQGIFSPSTDQLPDAENKEDIADSGVFDETAGERLGQYQFIAESELVAIDESHAFRNQESKRTRILRLLLSLPVPGEKDWPLVPPSGERFKPGEEFSEGIRRKVLCLSATPFNNEIEDIITQIGHFAQHQDWERPYGTLGQLEFSEEGFQRQLDSAIEAWQTSGDLGERSEAFRTIVKYARRHLHRTRKLSVPADQIEEKRMAGETEELRSRYDDLGPEYLWAGDGSEYEDAFASALEWLHDEERTEEDGVDVSQEELERKRFEARQNLESVLTSLFVQRSRVRALRIIEAAGGLSNRRGAEDDAPAASEMFREPRRPRQPLALNRRHRAEDTGEETLEAQILDNLFRLLYPAEGEEDAGPTGVSTEADAEGPQLTLKAYEISSLRGQRSVQAARNAIGFQVTNLIKRLQSTPYSFFRTLVRGVLRRSLVELAFVEQLLDEASGDHLELPDTLDEETLRENIDTFTGELNPNRFSALPNVAELIGGHVDPGGYGRLSLLDLVGLEVQADGSLTHPDIDVEGHFKEMLALIGDDDERARWDPAFEDQGPGEERQGWVSLLLEQVEEGTSSALWRDIESVLEVADDLSHRIWGRGNQNVGKPFDEIWKDFREAPPQRASGVADWLDGRLETDERACTLMGWLLVQAAARTYAGDQPARALIRGGDRTLVFTEYSDTQNYLLALFAALHVVFQDQADGGRRADQLRKRLIGEMKEIVSDLHEQAQQVTEADTERFHFADPRKFASPIAGGEEGWFAQWLEEVEETPSLFDKAVRDLSETFLRVHSDEADRLLPGEEIAPRGEVEDEEITIGSLSLDSQVDAFSPWYQLEPESDIEDKAEALGYARRLEEAALFPAYTILTTDVLAEGVNLQECGVVVHYDLPWNPTKLIQRNGRIDRRLNPTFEQPEKRRALHEQLTEVASEVDSSRTKEGWKAPPFYPPEQVYHLSVLPIEPEVLRSGADTALAARVRESLQEKLEAIRTLFGLSNWPIVLTHEDSQEVLTGELDFETPGFRRREDLFAALRQLEDQAAQANERFKSFDAQLSVHLRVPQSARNRLIDLFADPSDTDVAQSWDRVVAAGVVSWTKPRPESRTVYSENEWVSATGDDQGAISGILVVEDEEAEGGHSFVTWGVARGTSARDTIGRRILPAYVRPVELEPLVAEGSFLEFTRLAPLSDWQSIEGAAPSAPSDLAADLVKTVIDVALDEGITDPSRERKDDPYPASNLQFGMPPKLNEYLKKSSFMNTVLEGSRTSSRRIGFGEDPTEVMLHEETIAEDQEDWPPAFNLWVTFDQSE